MRTHQAVVRFALATSLCACASASGQSEGKPEGELAASDSDELSMVPGVDETALDRTADPCQDFYTFACGSYIQGLPADTQKEVRGFSQLARDRQALLVQLLADIQASWDPLESTCRHASLSIL